MSGALTIDFAEGAVAFRLQSGAGRGGLLARAVGVKPRNLPHVVDATAGLGRDALVLASLGCAVTLIERHPAVAEALAAALARAASGPPAVVAAAGRMTLLRGDARDVLPDLRPSVVLVDPMHPARGKSALVKQELRDLRRLVGEDDDKAALIAAARAAAPRVVLKWPRLAPLPDGVGAPAFTLSGRSTRFDVFLRSGGGVA